MKAIVFDTEGNGMFDESICQLSAIVIEDGTYTGFNRYFAVNQMNDHAVKVHGLSKMRLHELSHGQKFEDWAIDNIQSLLGADIYIGHNVQQDVRVLRKNLKRIDVDIGEIRTFCTMKHFDMALHLKSRTGQAKPPRLDELCAHYMIADKDVLALCERVFGEGRYRTHDARYDSAATLLCVLEGQRRGDVKGVIK